MVKQPPDPLQIWLNHPTTEPIAITPTLQPHQTTLQALHAHPTNTPLLTIPTTHTLSTSSALASPAIQSILRAHPPPHPTTPPQAALLLHVLLATRRPFYRPYFASLPPTILTPVTASPRLVACLKGTPLFPVVLRLRAEIDHIYRHWFLPIVQRNPALFDRVDRHQFLYAHAVVETRAIAIGAITRGEEEEGEGEEEGGEQEKEQAQEKQRNEPSKEDTDNSVLAPLLDLCNHSPSPNCRITPTPAGITLTTTRPITAGESLTVCYTPRGNTDLLLHYGFSLPDNPRDELLLTLDEPHDPATQLVLAVLVGELEFVLTSDQPLPGRLVRAVRVMVAPDLRGAIKRDFDAPIAEERTVVGVLNEIVAGLRCGQAVDKGDVPLEHMQDVEKEFVTFCDIYRRGLEHILDLAEARIRQIEDAIPEA